MADIEGGNLFEEIVFMGLMVTNLNNDSLEWKSTMHYLECFVVGVNGLWCNNLRGPSGRR